MNMDIWIRSQNRERLVKINQIYFYQFDKEAGLGDDYHIFANELEVGIYKNKERALEIIDEIQKIIKPTIITTNYECEIKENPTDKLSFNLDMNPQKTEVIEMNTYVYEMPEE